MTSLNVIGRSVPSLEGPAKVSGAAQYAVDARLPGMLWAKALRSPYPHARIISVDASRALALPGVYAVITGDDVRGMRTGNTFRDEPVIAWDEVRVVGDKVAAVCAVDNDTAERALALIDVAYEELPALLTAAEAMREGAPLIHPDFATYEGITPLETPSNAYGHVVKTAGDVARGFGEADVIVERTYETPRTHQLYLEPHTCLVDIAPDGVAQLWLASGTPGPYRPTSSSSISRSWAALTGARPTAPAPSCATSSPSEPVAP
jgi:CO/xanthine dehydrogenase Mo-binding subunit